MAFFFGAAEWSLQSLQRVVKGTTVIAMISLLLTGLLSRTGLGSRVSFGHGACLKQLWHRSGTPKTTRCWFVLGEAMSWFRIHTCLYNRYTQLAIYHLTWSVFEYEPPIETRSSTQHQSAFGKVPLIRWSETGQNVEHVQRQREDCDETWNSHHTKLTHQP